MAKTIKFNLICNGNPVRTIEDLQNNFSIEDVLEYFKNGLLHRWLKVRGYNSQLELVSSIKSDSSIKIIKELINIFKITSDENEIEKGIYIYDYLNERKELYSIYQEQQYTVNNIIDDYKNGYIQLVENIIENPDDVAIIKASISEIAQNYRWIFEYNRRDLFYELFDESPLAIMCLLMHSFTRDFYLPIWEENEDGELKLDLETDSDKRDMYNEICSAIRTSNFKNRLGENLISFAGATEGYWKDLEPKGKQYMIIKMERGNFVRSSGEIGGDQNYDDIVNSFVILDGIDYKSNSATYKLLYMEV